jgi:EmrB/QacA subfamily drug resistance transporter
MSDGARGATAKRNGTAPLSTEMPQYSGREKVITMLGVLLAMFLSSLDSTIVGTAMPRIIADLQGFDRYTWVSTAYLLTSTVTVPIYGKLSDQIGRKSIFILGVVLFLIGSALSGTAQTMNELIGYRAFQGIGAGALMGLAPAIIGDIFTPRERGKWQGVTGAVFGISSIIGPLIGGGLTEYASWHWVFYVNVPIGIIALLVLIFVMPRLNPGTGRASIDYTGSILIIVGVVALLLALSLGGAPYSWLSPQIIGLFIIAAIALTGFVFYELCLSGRGGQPVLEPRLFKNSIFTVSTIITLTTTMALYGSIFFIPLFLQGVVGQSATNSGLVMTPLLLAAIATSILSGQLVSRLGRYKWFAITGILISIIGQFLLVRLNINSTGGEVVLGMVVLGLGLGFGMSLYTVIVQNALPTRIGEATGALVFFRSIGGALALGLMGSLLNSAYLPAFHRALPASVTHAVPSNVLAVFDNPQILLSADMMTKVQAQFAAQGAQGQVILQQIIQAVKVGLVQGIHDAFIMGFVLMLVSLVVVFFLPEIALRGPERGKPISVSARDREKVQEAVAS